MARHGPSLYRRTINTAGVIREDDYEAGRIGFYGTYDPEQGGDSFRASVAADLEKKAGDTLFGQQLFVVKRTMRLREDFTGYLLDVQEPWQTSHGQRGDLLDLDVDETTIGARGFARLLGTAFGLAQELELGYFARYDQVGGEQQRLSPTTLEAYHTDTDLASNLGDVGLYGALNLRPASWVALRGGVRADVFTFDVNDLCAHQTISTPAPQTLPPPLDTSCMDQTDFGVHDQGPTSRPQPQSSTAVLPKASLLLGPFRHVTFSATYGQGVRSVDPIYITQDVGTPFAGIQAYEGGAAYAGGTGSMALVVRSVFFDTHVDKDYVFDQTVGRNVIGVGTSRVGWVGALRATGDWFDESANVTFVKSTFDDTHLLVPYIPDIVVRSDTAAWCDLPFPIRGDPFRGALSAGITYVGERPLPFGAVSGTIFTVDTSATLAWTHYEVGLIITNLLDTKYRLSEFNYASNFNPSGTGAPSGPTFLRTDPVVHRGCSPRRVRELHHPLRWHVMRRAVILGLSSLLLSCNGHDGLRARPVLCGGTRLSRCREGASVYLHQRRRGRRNPHRSDPARRRALPHAVGAASRRRTATVRAPSDVRRRCRSAQNSAATGTSHLTPPGRAADRGHRRRIHHPGGDRGGVADARRFHRRRRFERPRQRAHPDPARDLPGRFGPPLIFGRRHDRRDPHLRRRQLGIARRGSNLPAAHRVWNPGVFDPVGRRNARPPGRCPADLRRGPLHEICPLASDLSGNSRFRVLGGGVRGEVLHE